MVVAKAVLLRTIVDVALRGNSACVRNFLFVDKVICTFAGIANDENLRQAGIRAFRRDTAHIFNDAKQPAVTVARAQDKSLPQLTLKSDHVFFFEIELGSGVNEFRCRRIRRDIGEAVRTGEQMRSIQNRSDGSIRVDSKIACAIGRSGPPGLNIQLLIQLTNRGIRGKSLSITAPVKEELCFTVAPRIVVDAETRRPIVCKDVCLVRTAELLFLPANTGVDGNITIERPRIISVDSVVAFIGIHILGAVDTTNLTKVNLLSIPIAGDIIRA